MGDTPPDFPLVSSEPPKHEESTGSFVQHRDFRPVRNAVERLVSIEQGRRGELRVLTWLVGIALPMAVAFAAWMTLRLEDVRGDVRELRAIVATRDGRR